MYKWRNEYYKCKLTLASVMIFIFSCEIHLALVPRWKENMNNVCFHLWQKSQAVPSDPHLHWSRGTSLWYLAVEPKIWLTEDTASFICSFMVMWPCFGYWNINGSVGWSFQEISLKEGFTFLCSFSVGKNVGVVTRAQENVLDQEASP